MHSKICHSEARNVFAAYLRGISRHCRPWIARCNRALHIEKALLRDYAFAMIASVNFTHHAG